MKKVAPASPQTARLYDEIAKELESLGTEVSAMFGMPSLKQNGKAFAGLFGDAMVFKLEAEAHRDALALAGSELFDPSGMKRPMKAWVVVPSQHKKKWLAFAHKALESVPSTSAAKKPGASRSSGTSSPAPGKARSSARN